MQLAAWSLYDLACREAEDREVQTISADQSVLEAAGGMFKTEPMKNLICKVELQSAGSPP